MFVPLVSTPYNSNKITIHSVLEWNTIEIIMKKSFFEKYFKEELNKWVSL